MTNNSWAIALLGIAFLALVSAQMVLAARRGARDNPKAYERLGGAGGLLQLLAAAALVAGMLLALPQK